MLTSTLARYACKPGQLRLFLILAACLLFANSIGAAQDVVVVEQQFASPVMQQSGEVITQYYYPAAEQQFYIPQPQLNAYPPTPQIGFPTPQPRFLSSGPLYIDPNPTPPPQINIYGEVIIGEFIEEPESRDADAESKPPSEKNIDQKVVEQKSTDEPDPSTAKPEMEQTDDSSTQAEANSENKDNDQSNQVASNDQSKTKTEAQPAPDEGKKDSEPESAVAKSQRSDSFMQPRGPIAEDQRTHLFWVTVLTSIAIIPVFVLLPLILFKFRRGRKQQGDLST